MKSELNDEVESLASKLFNIYTAEVRCQGDTMLIISYDSVDEQTKRYYRAMAKYVIDNFKYRHNAMWIYDQIDGLGTLCDKILLELDKLQCQKTSRAMLWHLDMVLTLRSKEVGRRINDETY